MQLWSQPASTAFYEWTGILSAVLALLTAISTGLYLSIGSCRPEPSPTEFEQARDRAEKKAAAMSQRPFCLGQLRSWPV